ncbi:MAG TPA: hypothetical protein PKY29_03245 [Ferruginibacter sp.]|nr:hypothetical protein [Ferruginibacter sp.]HRO16763.1 hypothetical protein [Ferruginibacter sp.]HRQ20299.1 hypothetical protein [Ferruginibacter sp.]
MKEKITSSVEQAMNSVDGMQRAQAPGYLYAKILSGVYRRQTLTIWERISAFMARPAVTLTCIAVVVAINAIIIFKGNAVPAGNVIASAEPVDFYSYDIYNAENMEP